MSALIFYTQPHEAYIATDTLAVWPDGTPYSYTSKAILVPHLRTVIAGTGIGGLSTQWLQHINDNLVAFGIDDLDRQTPNVLLNLYDWLSSRQDFSASMTSTIYHIGISETSGEVCTYAYRSTNEFASERIGHGMRYKPECVVPENYELPADLITMMESQKSLEDAKPAESRLYIGGEIHVIQMLNGIFATYRLHRFADYAAITGHLQTEPDEVD